MTMDMMFKPLLISSIIEQAAVNYPNSKVISRLVGGEIVEHHYCDIYKRSKHLSHVLLSMGVKTGERVATLAWNTHRHLEAYYAISGLAAVVHTVNPRLYAEQIVYIINHAADEILLVDIDFVDLVVSIRDQLTSVKHIIVLTDSEQMPDLDGTYLCYETLLAQASDDVIWSEFDELTPACLCYTSGTTGNPKGVMYTHRSTVLHALASCMPNALNLSSDTVVLPVVPMYHVSAWGLPYSGLMSGATLVLPGAGMDGQSLFELIRYSQASLLLGVPTVWLGLTDYLQSAGESIPSVKTIAVGGAAAPKALVSTLEEQHGIYLMPLWGMTETSPLATFGRKDNVVAQLPLEQRYERQCSAGKNSWGIELSIFDDDDNVLPRDGETSGNLKVRGHWVAGRYYRNDDRQNFSKGWFDTGDIATIDNTGYLTIVDRKKDVIKSGGEWISSIELENAAIAFAGVLEACVIGVPHKKWDERPLLFVVLREPENLDKQVLLDYLSSKVAKWWLPDDIIVVDSLPHTATGKLQKNVLRDQYKDYLWSESSD